MTDGDLPVVEPPFDADSTDVTVAGVLLAAGTSSRFGEQNKLLATVDGEPMVRRSLDPLLEADLDRVIVVVGHEGDVVRAALPDDSVTVVENDAYADGQATSVARGIEAVRAALGESVDGVLIALGDMPDVRVETVETLVDAFAAGVGDPLAAACDGERGNPVCFGRQFFDRLERVAGDVGGRSILLSAPAARLVETGDPGVRRDVDRPADL